MSHYTVLVIGEDWEEQLIPFCEHDEGGDEFRKHMEFIDETLEIRRSYESATKTMYLDKDNNAFYTDPRDACLDEDDEKLAVEKEKEYLEKGFEKADVFIKDMGVDFDEYADEEGHRKDPNTGLYGYWTNPNAKWDWYSLGGRWSGMLRVKDGAEGTRGRPGVFGPDEGLAEDNLRVDQCSKGDLDFEGMLELRRKEYEGYWDHAEEEYKKYNLDGAPFEEALKLWGRKLNECRKQWEDGGRPGSFYEFIQADRATSDAQQAVGHYGQELFEEPWPENPTREMYVSSKARKPFGTYAVLKDGEWYEKGQMGWFGMSSGEVSEEEWDEKFAELVDELPDDTLLSVVDCHI